MKVLLLLILGVMCWYVGVKTGVKSQKLVFEKAFFYPFGVLRLNWSHLRLFPTWSYPAKTHTTSVRDGTFDPSTSPNMFLEGTAAKLTVGVLLRLAGPQQPPGMTLATSTPLVGSGGAKEARLHRVDQHRIDAPKAGSTKAVVVLITSAAM
jgi:hypothetical protein